MDFAERDYAERKAAGKADKIAWDLLDARPVIGVEAVGDPEQGGELADVTAQLLRQRGLGEQFFRPLHQTFLEQVR